MLNYSYRRDIQERYRTLGMYKITVTDEELEVVSGIEEKWKALFIQARQVDRSLITVKKKFTLVCVFWYVCIDETNDVISISDHQRPSFNLPD